jgi:ABC-type antimicrobial peptide transport system permease subunit
MSEARVETGEFIVGKAQHTSEWRRVISLFCQSGRSAVVGLVIIIILFVVGIFAPWLSPYDPY